jgi:hypothetical protein
MLTAIYLKYNPDKLEDHSFIQNTLKQYAGRERELLAALKQKYGMGDPLHVLCAREAREARVTWRNTRYTTLLATNPHIRATSGRSAKVLPELPTQIFRQIFSFVGARHICTFSHINGPCAFDTNGALFCIGSSYWMQIHANPHQSGEVVAAMSSIYNNDRSFGAPDRFVAHHLSLTRGQRGGRDRCFVHLPNGGGEEAAPMERINWTEDGSDQWMSVDLGKQRALVPNHYCLRHGNNHSGQRLIHWQLQGSVDGSSWVVLKEHENDQSLPRTGFGVASWAIDGVRDAYQHFRIRQRGGPAILCCAGIELYGELLETSGASR